MQVVFCWVAAGGRRRGSSGNPASLSLIRPWLSWLTESLHPGAPATPVEPNKFPQCEAWLAFLASCAAWVLTLSGVFSLGAGVVVFFFCFFIHFCAQNQMWYGANSLPPRVKGFLFFGQYSLLDGKTLSSVGDNRSDLLDALRFILIISLDSISSTILLNHNLSFSTQSFLLNLSHRAGWIFTSAAPLKPRHYAARRRAPRTKSFHLFTRRSSGNMSDC